jgi:hypothetical protein
MLEDNKEDVELRCETPQPSQSSSIKSPTERMNGTVKTRGAADRTV